MLDSVPCSTLMSAFQKDPLKNVEDIYSAGKDMVPRSSTDYIQERFISEDPPIV